MAEGFLPPIIGHLKADVTGWAKGMAEVKAETMKATGTAEKAFTGMAGVGKIALLGVGAAAVTVGGVSLKMAGDFESSTNRLVTSAGEIHGNLELVRKGMLQMAGEVGYSANELSKGMYLVESAGFHGADGLKVLRASAEGAKAENADLAVVANAVTSALVDYHLKSSDAAQVTTTLVAAVSQGKTTFAEMTSALHSVLPIASAAHISLADITAALASMTVHGMSADQAAQNMAHAIQHLQTVTAPQAKELAMLGISARQLSDDLGKKGLTGTLQEISEAIQKRMGADGQVVLQVTDALKKMPPEVRKLGMEAAAGTISMGDYAKAAKDLSVEAAGQAAGFATLLKSTHGLGQDQKSGSQIMQAYAAALKAATGDSTGLNVALMLTGENAEYTRNAVKAVSEAHVEAGNHVKGWADIQATFNQHLERAQAGMGAMAITLGTALIPYAIKALETFAVWGDWLGKHQAVTVALASAIGGVLLVAIAAYTIAMVTAAIATIAATWPILLIIAAAALLAAGIAILITHWGQVTNAVKEFGSWLAGGLVQLINQAGDAFSALGEKINHLIDPIRGFLSMATGIKLPPPDISAYDAANKQILVDHRKLNEDLAKVTQLKVSGAPQTEISKAELQVTKDVVQAHHDMAAAHQQSRTAAQSLGDFFSALGAKVHELPGLIGGAASAVGRAFSGIGTAAHNLLTTIGGFFSSLGSAASKGWEEFSKHPAYWIGYIVGYVPTKLSELQRDAAAWLIHMVEDAAKWRGDMQRKAEEAAANFVLAVMNELPKLPGLVWGVVTNVLGTVDRWSADLSKKAWDAAWGFERAILDELWNLPGQMNDVGVRAALGIIDGIKSMIKAGQGAIGEFVQGLVDGAHKKGQGHSPYQLFADEVGEVGIAGGIALGIDRGAPGVQASMAGLLGGLGGSVGGPSLSVSDGGGSMGSAGAGPGAAVVEMQETNTLLERQNTLLSEIRDALRGQTTFSLTAYQRTYKAPA